MRGPQYGRADLEVPLKTVKNFLTGKALAQPDSCQNPACPVVYPGEEGGYTLEEVRFPIHDEGAPIVYYGFGWSREELAEALGLGAEVARLA
ncbi:MAG: hypothetical protein ACK4G4_00215 [Thermus sp.]|uniref:hypothetical protein n=1 Tax=Thermus sp. TaxID=275 RepID=UPI00391A949B